MIAAYVGDLAALVIDRIAGALGKYTDRRPVTTIAGGATLLSLNSGTAACDTVFYGWLDNAAQLAAELGLPPEADPAAIYSKSLKRWGDGADRRVIGNYCAITSLPGHRLRLVRSPWSAPPLHFVANSRLCMASNILGALFAAGQPREVDTDYVADQLLQDHHDCEPRGWYRGVGRVPLGCSALISAGGVHLHRFYDPCDVPQIRFRCDEDYVEAARQLLNEAAQAALAGASKPAIMLSGGLDSALVADALLTHLPADRRLPSFTFTPLPGWDGQVGPHHYGNERALVGAFAECHPQLQPHFPDSSQHGFDYRLRELLAACEVPSANVANVGIFHGPWEAAKVAGCDVMVTADLGNFTISNEAPWYASEYLLRGRWLALCAAVRSAPTDDRPLWRKLAALSLLPLLPRRLQGALRHWFAAAPQDWNRLVSMVSDETRAAHSVRRGADRQLAIGTRPCSRRDWILRAWQSADSGEDIDLGFERMHGIRKRDVTAWRPLVEFCMGLPTEQFVKGAEHRRLARRLAIGRLPQQQRLNARYGLHHPDWHERLGRRRNELKDYALGIADHPVMGKMIDTQRMVALLDDWPADPPLDPAEAWPRSFAITRAVTAAMFIGHAEGRNAL